MNELVTDLPGTLLRTTLGLSVAALVVRGLTWLCRNTWPGLQRVAWSMVLVQGLCLFQLPIEIPWYESVPVRQTPVVSLVPADRFEQAARPRVRTLAPNPSRSLRASGRFTWLAVILAAWLLGMGVTAGLGLAGYLCFLLQLLRAKPAHPDWDHQWQRLLRRHGITRRIPLRVHGILGPLLCRTLTGYQVVVPRDLWGDLTVGQRRAILQHELAHFQRGDLWKTLLARLAALPHWFNPLAWLAVRNFEETGEWLCDRAATAEGPEQAAQYAKALLRLGETSPGQPVYSSAVRGPTLSNRIRRLVSPHPLEDSVMKKLLFFLPLCLAVVALVRVELVAKEPSAQQADLNKDSVSYVESKIEELRQRLQDVEKACTQLEPRLESLNAKIEAKYEELKVIADGFGQLSDEARRRDDLLRSGDEAQQLSALEGVKGMGDEGVILLAKAAEESGSKKVRRAALKLIAELGENGYPAIVHCYETLSSEDRVYLAEQLAKQKTDHRLVLMAMGKEADPSLAQTLARIGTKIEGGLPVLAAAVDNREDDDKFVDYLVKLGGELEDDNGLLLLYAVARDGRPQHRIAACKAAVKRKYDGLAVLVPAFQSEDAKVREAVVRAANQIGGNAARYLIDQALQDYNEELRQAAQQGLTEEKKD